jgi:hypothetical protein
VARGDADYVRERYGVPAKVGMLVTIAGNPCRIVGFRGGYLRVRYLEEPILGVRNAHPVWSVQYPDRQTTKEKRCPSTSTRSGSLSPT